MPEPLRKAAFIDRDGVLNEEREFVYRIEDFAFVRGAVDALAQLQAAGYLLVVVTNQSGIARGLYTEEDYLRLTAHMREQLLGAGIRVDSVEYCPHLPDAPVARYRLECACRKPQPGMLTAAIGKLGIDASGSILIGDRASDIQAGRRAGIGRCFLVRSGKPLTESDLVLADGVYDDLAACVKQVLRSGA
jgi:D-glycero-D-manno-heptose 1,7-bisphosphate phosphatase